MIKFSQSFWMFSYETLSLTHETWNEVILFSRKRWKLKWKDLFSGKTLKLNEFIHQKKDYKKWNENFFSGKRGKLKCRDFCSQENDDGNYQI